MIVEGKLDKNSIEKPFSKAAVDVSKKIEIRNSRTMSQERWQSFSKNEQLKHIASEVKRASLYEKENPKLKNEILERGLNLVDLSLEDDKWKDNLRLLFLLRNLLAESYIGSGLPLDRIYALF